MEDDTLAEFMQNLFEAGFDVQVILAKGFDFAVRTSSVMETTAAYMAASGAVKAVARELCIDRESRFTEARSAWKQEMIDRALRR